jgi:hypothetical protein
VSAPTWYGDKVVKVAYNGESAYGNYRWKLHLETGPILETSPGYQLPKGLLPGEMIEFTLDPKHRINDIRATMLFEVATSSGTRWWVADSLDHATVLQKHAYPNDKIDTVRWASDVPSMSVRLGKRQLAVLHQIGGGREVGYLKPSERKVVHRALLRHGLITRSAGSLVVTPRGRTYLLSR